MAFWPLTPSATVSADLTAATVVTDATAHVKGAWVELTASAPDSVTGLVLSLGGTNVANADGRHLLDVAIGSAGSEFVVLENVGVGGAALSDPRMLPIPYKFPAGVRVAARAQSIGTSRSITVGGHFVLGGSGPVAGGFVTEGANTATSGGVQGNASTPVQIVASTAERYVGVIPCVSPRSTGAGGGLTTVTLYVGASTAEQPVAKWRSGLDGNEVINLTASPEWVDIPAGSRVSMTGYGTWVDFHFIGITG